MAKVEQQAKQASSELLLPRLLMIFSVAALVIIGLVVVYSASSIDAIYKADSSYSVIIKQMAFAAVGALMALVITKLIPFDAWRGRLMWGFYFLCMGLLLLVSFIGTTALGATRWLVLGPVSLQPSEFAKVAFILVAAWLIDGYSKGHYTRPAFIIRFFLLVVVPLFILFFTQSDLGTTCIILVGIFTCFWLLYRNYWMVGGIVLAGICFGIGAIIVTPYRINRLSFLDPWKDPTGTSYQLIHSFFAFARGGLTGVGLGGSHEKFQYLPEAQTDFVYSILGEEAGLIGTLLVLGLFMLFLYAGLSIARQSKSNFGNMVVTSLCVMLVFQAFLNIGSVIGVAPTTGKPLPFLSNGGSSLLSSFLMVGIVLASSFSDQADEVYEKRRSDLRLISWSVSSKFGSSLRSSGSSASNLHAEAPLGQSLRSKVYPRSDSQQAFSRPSRPSSAVRGQRTMRPYERNQTFAGRKHLSRSKGTIGRGRDSALSSDATRSTVNSSARRAPGVGSARRLSGAERGPGGGRGTAGASPKNSRGKLTSGSRSSARRSYGPYQR